MFTTMTPIQLTDGCYVAAYL